MLSALSTAMTLSECVLMGLGLSTLYIHMPMVCASTYVHVDAHGTLYSVYVHVYPYLILYGGMHDGPDPTYADLWRVSG